MHLTKKASYGLIAALELAANTDAGPLSAGTIAEKYALPAPFMEKILHQLRRSGLVAAQQGRGGGYTLIDDPPTVSVRKVLESLDESLDLVGCITADSGLPPDSNMPYAVCVGKNRPTIQSASRLFLVTRPAV